MKFYKILIIVLFLVLIILPLIFFNFKSKANINEHRMLADEPQLFKDKSINKDFVDDLHNYINDRFGLKNILVKINSIIKFKYLNEKTNKKVLIGKNNWLFYLNDRNLEDYFKLNLINNQSKIKLIENIKKRSEWCKSNDIKLLVMVFPNKHNVYPEYYPLERPGGISKSQQIREILDSAKVDYIYPLDYLKNFKNNVKYNIYLKNDTHWNGLAYAEVYKMIKEYLHNTFPDYSYKKYELKYNKIYSYGDLNHFLGIPDFYKTENFFVSTKHKPLELIYNLKKIKEHTLVPHYEFMHINFNKDLPNVYVFMDSYFEYLSVINSVNFHKSIYKWKAFDIHDKQNILEDKPDLIIWEMVERLFERGVNSKWE